MTRQKGKFLTFCFSLVPGAGQMYLGFMKQGLSLMTVFAALCAFSTWLAIGPLLLFAPIIWFYSFFDVINKNSLDPEEFYTLEDHYIWGDGWMDMGDVFKDSMRNRNSRKVLAIAMYIVAGCMIWSVLRYFTSDIFGFHWLLGAVISKIPVLVAAGVIIWLAYRLMQSVGTDEEPFFADETETDVPYPLVQPPVLHMDGQGEEKAGKMQDGDAVKTRPEAAADEMYAAPEPKESSFDKLSES